MGHGRGSRAGERSRLGSRSGTRLGSRSGQGQGQGGQERGVMVWGLGVGVWGQLGLVGGGVEMKRKCS